MIVPDTSAWVEFLRNTGNPVHRALQALVEDDAEIALTEYIAFEVLAGARSPRDLEALEDLMYTYPVLPLDGIGGYDDAAELYRVCRRGGETIRKLSDCLIAVPVIRAEAELLHNDRDFDALARHSGLRIYAVA